MARFRGSLHFRFYFFAHRILFCKHVCLVLVDVIMAAVVNTLYKQISVCSSVSSKIPLFKKCRFKLHFSQATSTIYHIKKRNFATSKIFRGSAARAETTSTTQGLSKLQAQELVLRLNDEERGILISALHEYQSKLIKDEYEGKKICYFIQKY